VIFPGEIVGQNERPGWLVNVTNDAWYGRSPGPYQHLQQARMRAIEEGLPLVRAANNGISAVIDPLGRVVGSLPLATEGVLDARLPRAIGPTLYARLGDMTATTILAVAFFVVLRRRRKPK
jgi:apolipoprotein N-acyltransferase